MPTLFAWSLGLALAAAAAAPVDTRHLSAVPAGPAAPAAPGARVALTLDVSPRASMHVYAPQQKDFVPISLTLEADPAVVPAEPRFPKPETFRPGGAGEAQLVYSRPFRIVQEVTLARTPAALARARAAGGVVTVKGTLRYQACDNAICYRPVSVPVSWTVPLASGR